MTESQAAPAGANDTLQRWYELTSGVPLGRASSMPLHARISDVLVGLIESGELVPGERLPSERELAKLFGVSLAPVRQAILDAVDKGLLVRDRGRGTFVRGTALDEKISILHSLTESMRDQQMELETRVVRQQRVATPPSVATALWLSDAECMLLERVAIVDREPVALLQAYLSLTSYPDLEIAAFANRSLYETLREQYGTVVTKAHSVIDVARGSSAEADTLGIASGDPLLRVEGTAFSDSGEPVEYYRVLYRADRVRFHLESHRETDRVVRLVPDRESGDPKAG